MREELKPLLFTDERGTQEKLDRDPVAPAKRSAVTLAKVHSRKLADGTSAMSFAGVLDHMATIVRNTLRPKAARPGEATFAPTTIPNAKQQQALDLLATITVSV